MRAFVAAGTVNAYIDLASLGAGDLTLSRMAPRSPSGCQENTRAMLVGMFDALDIPVTFAGTH